MRSEFGSVDREEWKGRITGENWDGLPPSEHIGARQRTRPPAVIASPESMISAAFLQNHPKG
jgi:hypothetical protein